MRVALADDSRLFRDGLAGLLAATGVEVTACVGDGRALLAAVETDPPDAVVLDIRMPPSFTDEGLRVAAELRARHPAVGILVLSTYAEWSFATHLLGLTGGGAGYLVKDRVEDVDALRDALTRVAKGEPVVDPEIVVELVRERRRADQSGLDRLGDREREVLTLMAEGRSNTGIARRLHLSAKSVETYVSSIFTKLNLPPAPDDNRRVQAVLTWLRH
ncbi:response regulator transcription factor [Actinoplanes sp. NPDC051470]|uniref:response regulator transcription factor n=1 Tax=unclassified Actinoplanes TaxID=2626549 RepID=UPI003443D709